VTLRFRRGATATLALESLDGGVLLDRITGASPLRLAEPVPGPVRVTVSTRSRLPFRFRVSSTFLEP
jgi:hypothetical protein